MAIKIGILGFAHGHVNSYCKEWRENPSYDIEVAAGWDHDENRLRTAAETYGLQPYADLQEMLAREDIKAVVIASETSMHADLVEKAAASGKSIIVQKPLALTIAQADRIVAAVDRYKVPFTLAWQMRVDPQNMKMKEIIESGILGKIFMVRRRHGLGTHQWAGFADTWHVNPEFNRDIWGDDASHPIDFIHWLLGIPETVTAEIETLYNPKVPNDNGISVFRYKDGPLAEVFCSFTCVAAENTTEIIAENGTIIQNFGDVPSVIANTNPDNPGLKWYLSSEKKWTYSEIASPPNHGFRIIGLSGPLADFLHGKRDPIATAIEGRTSLRMLLASYLSSRTGSRISLDDTRIDEI
ncbi:MAG: Gfo/Idh/MocA family protein [Saccharofermentanales bacterium]